MCEGARQEIEAVVVAAGTSLMRPCVAIRLPMLQLD